jgi:Tol biopolymer transport system component
MEASPSPDGRYLALQLWSQIWLLDMSNGNARLLTDAITRPDEHMSPRWSPDGRWIQSWILATGTTPKTIISTGSSTP